MRSNFYVPPIIVDKRMINKRYLTIFFVSNYIVYLHRNMIFDGYLYTLWTGKGKKEEVQSIIKYLFSLL